MRRLPRTTPPPPLPLFLSLFHSEMAQFVMDKKEPHTAQWLGSPPPLPPFPPFLGKGGAVQAAKSGHDVVMLPPPFFLSPPPLQEPREQKGINKSLQKVNAPPLPPFFFFSFFPEFVPSCPHRKTGKGKRLCATVRGHLVECR